MKSTIRTQVPALLLCILAPCLGFFLRLNQLRLERHADGTVAWGGVYSVALLILCGLFLLALICLLLPLNKRPTGMGAFPVHPLPNGLLLLGAAALLAGNVLNWNSGATGALVSLLGIAAAVFAALFALSRLRKKIPTPLLYMFVSLYLGLHLILSFKNWNSDPAVQDYCYTLLAILCAMLAIFQLAAFCFGKGKRRITIFWSLAALLFCAVSLADGVHGGDLATLCIHAGLLLLTAVHGVCLLLAPEKTN
ncbi:MAG: hypothetical protein IJ357_00530 [Oscillospiraceae bacterium]|nr:hypothetical protein [Oscillospiraceae bacterium]